MTLKEKYHGKTLTTDEAAKAQNEINDAMQELESIEYKTGEDYLLLKWGSIKGCDFKSPKAKELLALWYRGGVSASAMLQHDTNEQQAIVLQLIDLCNGTIQNDWDGEHYTKQQAKDYITGYGNE